MLSSPTYMSEVVVSCSQMTLKCLDGLYTGLRILYRRHGQTRQDRIWVSTYRDRWVNWGTRVIETIFKWREFETQEDTLWWDNAPTWYQNQWKQYKVSTLSCAQLVSPFWTWKWWRIFFGYWCQNQSKEFEVSSRSFANLLSMQLMDAFEKYYYDKSQFRVKLNSTEFIICGLEIPF